MPSDKRKFGDLGEKVAVDFLKKKGYAILDTNYQNSLGRRLGEIDIVAKDPERKELVFVEVKTRELNKFEGTLPEENITFSKLRKIEKIASVYLRQNSHQRENYRFDAISVWLDEGQRKAKIKHIQSL